MNNKDHLVGQLTKMIYTSFLHFAELGYMRNKSSKITNIGQKHQKTPQITNNTHQPTDT